mmetsp:Transcript_37933/g.150862  ORF Transcript_37933/g.150862 Transcript_37933/m.150862 type:complete len:422 (-) Transcript_37933:130-1395(-)|eukprot:CAMPEP_0113960982 /NCGR_PEP_ID=MMETSP0011_2-20120614/5039_1 /TAXON_ID=101924 /ORGANISM="Rhodosorus marinus" /LENGTH=421 /DNA_ID=CAMNT_0000972539 /DNA_START=20 /DNA_END=1285 /DNA_ORIENTATION=- /assembly_acc=CAM_ASM_000156
MAQASGKGSSSSAVVRKEEFAVPELPRRLRPVVKRPRSRTVLPEEEYVDSLEQIITRDFFPELPKMKLQNAYDEAWRANDFQAAAEIDSRMKNAGVILQSPSATPGAASEVSSLHGAPGPSEWSATPSGYAGSVSGRTRPPGEHPSLDSFHAQCTSEDNESFSKVLEGDEEKRRGKAWWLYETEEEHKKRRHLRLESGKKNEEAGLQNIITAAGDGRKAPEHEWRYEARNRLMYYPPDAPRTVEEHERIAALPRKGINHANTRFQVYQNPPSGSPRSSLNPTPLYGTRTISEKSSDIGDSEQSGGDASNNGYEMVPSSPSPSDVNSSPIVTWGSVAATPKLLHGRESNAYKIFKPRRREEVALRLERKTKSRKYHDSIYHGTPKSTPGTSVRSTPGSATPLTPAGSRLASRMKKSYANSRR